MDTFKNTGNKNIRFACGGTETRLSSNEALNEILKEIRRGGKR